MIIDCVSDLHGHYPQLEGGDLLIVAGDCTGDDHASSQLQFLSWLQWSKYTKKILIAGNHDNWMVNLKPDVFDKWGIKYLCDSDTEFEYYHPKFPEKSEGFIPSVKRNLKIWGSPWTKTFKGMNPRCKAFTCETEDQLAQKWMMIPTDTDILITHCPPFTILDKTGRGEQVGSTSLMAEHMHHLRPKLWVFGHIHAAYGQVGPYEWNSTKYVNASHVDECYAPINKPIRVIL